MTARPTLSLRDAQLLVADGERRMRPLYDYWRFLEGVRRTGQQRVINASDLQPWVPTVTPHLLQAVNLVLGHTSIIAANCVATDPALLVEAVGSGAVGLTIAEDGSLLGAEDLEQNAKLAQATLAYFWKRTKSTRPLRDATEDMVNLGNGFLTAGWAFVAAPKRKPNSNEVGDAIDANADTEAESLPDLDALSAGFPLTAERPLIDEPYTEYVSPYDILVPATARRMETTPWVVRRLVKPVSELQANTEFSHLDTLTADATVLAGADRVAQEDRAGADRSTVFEYATVYEMWNMAERRLMVFQAGSAEFLYDGPIPYDYRFPPFIHLRNHNDGGNTFWAFGDLENLLNPQLMLNDTIKAQMEEMHKAGNTYFMHAKLMTPAVRKALESPVSDKIIPLDLPANMSLEDVLRPVARQATPGDTFQMEGKLTEYMRQVPGLSDFQIGENGANRMAATAVAAVEGSTTLRARNQVQTVEEAAADLGALHLSLCQQFLDADRAVRIAGPGGAAWLAIRPSDIYGEFQVRTEGGSTKAVNPATLAQRGQLVANVVIPMLSSVAGTPALWPAARQALRDMGLDADHLMSGLNTPPPAPEPAPGDQAPAGPEMPDPGPAPAPSPAQLGMGPGLKPEELAALQQLNAQSSALEGSGQHPADALLSLGGPPVPAATNGDIFL